MRVDTTVLEEKKRLVKLLSKTKSQIEDLLSVIDKGD